MKPLVRLTCVCKSWNSTIISDPNFARLHFHRSPKTYDNHLILTLQKQFPLAQDKRQIDVVSCTVRSFIQNPSSTVDARDGRCRYTLKSKYWVLDSCNGLVCLCGNFYDVDDNLAEYWFRVWNPVTRFRSKKSPCLRVDLRVNQLGCAKFGFGYDGSSDTYKVVAVLCDRNAMEDSRVKVYSLGDSFWRDIQSFPAFPLTVGNEGKFVNGTLNWLAIRNLSGSYAWNTVTIDKLVIVSLDLGTEIYKQFSLPDGIDEVPRVEPTLGVLRGCMYLFHDSMNTHFVAWQMKEFGVENSWTQFVKVSYQHLHVENNPWSVTQFFALVPLCISENGDILMLGNDDPSEIVMYDRRDNKVESTKIFKFRGWINARDHVQSLAQPH